MLMAQISHPPSVTLSLPQRRDRRYSSTVGSDTIIRLPLKTITPIIGGGVSPGELDDSDPVRVPAIRGQLRFWWRAMFVHTCGSSKELADREAEIWGGVHSKHSGYRRSRVDLWVTGISPNPEALRDTRKPTGSVPYVLWASGLSDSKWLRRRPGLRFVLHVRVAPALADDVYAALRAWLLMGGIGSRTRRGCGSLTIDRTSSDSLALDEWLPAPKVSDIERILGQVTFRDCQTERTPTPSLDGALLRLGGRIADSALNAWDHTIGILRGFRPTQRRRISGGTSGRYLLSAQKLAPLAGLGLPIVGLSKSPNARIAWRDADGVHDRLASPLIIKPLPLRDGRFASMALWLRRCDPVGSLVWLMGDSERDIVQRTFPPSSPMRVQFDQRFVDLDDEAARKTKNGPRTSRGRHPTRDRRKSKKRSR